MQHQAEMQIYKEILDKFRQLMAMEAQEDISPEEILAGEDKSDQELEKEDKGMYQESPKGLMPEQSVALKTGEAEEELEGESGFRDEMKAFFGGGKPLMPEKKGLKVGVTEIAMMPGKKKPKY